MVRTALLWSALVFIGLLIVWGFKCILQEHNCFGLFRWLSTGFASVSVQSRSGDEAAEALVAPSDSVSPVARNRIRSLDAFRGYLSYLAADVQLLTLFLFFSPQQLDNCFNDFGQLRRRRVSLPGAFVVERPYRCRFGLPLVIAEAERRTETNQN